MSPAAIPEELLPQPDLHQDQLQAVGKAFDALLLTLYRLTHRHNDLKQYTQEAFKQYTNVTRLLPPQDRPHAMEVQQRLLDQQKQLCEGLVLSKPVEEQSLNSMEIMKTLVSHQNVDENTMRAIVDGVKGYKALLRSDGLSQISSADSCLFARGPDLSSLEQDFTTNGTQGSLHCPFSKPKSPRPGSDMASRKDDGGPKIQIDTCGHDHLDPIKADQEERRSSTTPSVGRSSQGRCPVSRCPIRYLDKHSPEEIAEYVERHKHEIPRSHAICVKRYQRDPQNMRQLDAKYGGLINMISGLSAKHQAFLPEREANGDGDVEGEGEGRSAHSTSPERVGKWAEEVDPVTPVPPTQEVEDRESRFDRPLREVRVGESPSRPWGIPVPITEEPAASSTPFPGSTSGPVSPDAVPADPLNPSSGKTPAKPAGRCPFGHDAPKAEPVASPPAPVPAPAPAPAATVHLESPWSNWGNFDPIWGNFGKVAKGETVENDAAKKDDGTPKTDTNTLPTHVTFNGPVFFGYSAEETASLMQQLAQLNLGKS